MSPLSPRSVFSYWLWWPALPVPVRVLGVSHFSVFIPFLFFVLFLFLFICIHRVPA